MFFVTLDVSAGIPGTNCIGPVAEDFAGVFSGLGMAGLICGILLLFTFFFSYCLWKSYDD